MIQISLERRSISLSRKELALVNAASHRSAMLSHVKKIIAAKSTPYSPLAPLFVPPSYLQTLTKIYSEQLVYEPLKDIQYWFTYSIGAFLAPGYPQLYYYAHLLTGKKIPPSKSAVAAIGEGTAGLIGQQLYKARILARPNHDFPDIVMEDRSSSKTFLIEAKATSGGITQARKVIDDNLIAMIGYTAACVELDSRLVVGILISTALEKVDHFHTSITEVLT